MPDPDFAAELRGDPVDQLHEPIQPPQYEDEDDRTPQQFVHGGQRMFSTLVALLLKHAPGMVSRSIPPLSDDPEETLKWRLRMTLCNLGTLVLLLISFSALIGVLFFVPPTKYVSANGLDQKITLAVDPLKTEITALSAAVKEQSDELKRTKIVQEEQLVESLRRQIRDAERRACTARRVSDWREVESQQAQIDQLQDSHNRLRGRGYEAGDCRLLQNDP